MRVDLDNFIAPDEEVLHDFSRRKRLKIVATSRRLIILRRNSFVDASYGHMAVYSESKIFTMVYIAGMLGALYIGGIIYQNNYTINLMGLYLSTYLLSGIFFMLLFLCIVLFIRSLRKRIEFLLAGGKKISLHSGLIKGNWGSFVNNVVSPGMLIQSRTNGKSVSELISYKHVSGVKEIKKRNPGALVFGLIVFIGSLVVHSIPEYRIISNFGFLVAFIFMMGFIFFGPVSYAVYTTAFKEFHFTPGRKKGTSVLKSLQTYMGKTVKSERGVIHKEIMSASVRKVAILGKQTIYHPKVLKYAFGFLVLTLLFFAVETYFPGFIIDYLSFIGISVSLLEEYILYSLGTLTAVLFISFLASISRKVAICLAGGWIMSPARGNSMVVRRKTTKKISEEIWGTGATR